MKRFLSLFLALAMSLSLTTSSFAAGGVGNNSVETYMEEIADGHLFIQRTDDKLVAIATNDIKHIVNIAIKDTSKSDAVYQWLINDYPVAAFCPDDPSFWNDIIVYAEGKMDEASLAEFSFEEVDENEPMVISSAGADLAEDLNSIVGAEYSDRFTGSVRVIEGHVYRLYETMEYYISKVNTFSWGTGITVAAWIVGFLGVAATTITVSRLCGILGLASLAIDGLMPVGKMNKYQCAVTYTRYVTVDSGSRRYGPAFKFRYFDGYEDANFNSRGRAHVIPDSEILRYDMNQSEEFFNSGIFNEAYKAYNNIL